MSVTLMESFLDSTSKAAVRWTRRRKVIKSITICSSNVYTKNPIVEDRAVVLKRGNEGISYQCKLTIVSHSLFLLFRCHAGAPKPYSNSDRRCHGCGVHWIHVTVVGRGESQAKIESE